MKKMLICLLLAGALTPTAGQAQVMLDMSRVTCADYLAMPPHDAAVFAAWVSGWMNQKAGYTWIDFGGYEKNIASVRQFCAANPQAIVMSSLKPAAK